MTRAFSEQEKKAIREALMDKGRECFERYGLQKTSIKDLTEAVGIAQGSFYSFFGSKEELFFEIMQQEELRLRKMLLDDVEDSGSVSREVLRNLLTRGLRETQNSTLMRHLFMGDDYEKLLRRLPQEVMEKHIVDDREFWRPLFEQWQNEGTMIRADINVVMGVVRSLFMVTLHKKEIGAQIIDDVLNMLVDFVVGGLINEDGATNNRCN